MASKVFLLAALVVVTSAELRPSYNAPRPSYSAPAPSGVPQYKFNWLVKDANSGNDFGQDEARNGYDTQGSYYVQLPDGRLQRVSYTVNGDSGYIAQVEYQGEAQYPAYQPSYKPTPSYQPAPVYG
ncbi:cuticle protein 7-like [Cherax quadricarinatus]|uniref:cuticle protein 7-like n=1 Tax=Cherax quadricarinatus TaxID=27406 RepID=UPI002378FC72|nr:cuticle protein 7-like [Cherax quadricarinatus]